MNWNAIAAIVRKDLKVVFQNKGISVPLIVAPVFIMVILLPGCVLLARRMGYLESRDMIWLEMAIELLPGGFSGTMEDIDIARIFTEIILVYGAAGMYPLLPLMVVASVASDSFAGEKERKTLEALLYTPTTDWEMLLGKFLSAWLPALAISWGSFVLYSIMANIAAWPVMGRVFFPSIMWVILALWVAPAIAAFGLGIMVLISSRAQTFQQAHQLSAVVILPGFMLLGGGLIGVISSSGWMVALLGSALWVVDIALLWFGNRRFRRFNLAMEI